MGPGLQADGVDLRRRAKYEAKTHPDMVPFDQLEQRRSRTRTRCSSLCARSPGSGSVRSQIEVQRLVDSIRQTIDALEAAPSLTEPEEAPVPEPPDDSGQLGEE